MLLVAVVDLFSSGGVGKRYVLPVLWISLHLTIMCKAKTMN